MEKTGAAEAIAGAIMKVGAKSGGHAILIAIIYIVRTAAAEGAGQVCK